MMSAGFASIKRLSGFLVDMPTTGIPAATPALIPEGESYTNKGEISSFYERKALFGFPTKTTKISSLFGFATAVACSILLVKACNYRSSNKSTCYIMPFCQTPRARFSGNREKLKAHSNRIKRKKRAKPQR